ncbi:hypothetical protein ANRL4_00494 [Anaerolineae bacterium]|nr:hypothetical protein ANRL4_00494 [Anaerolineae bacterium]
MSNGADSVNFSPEALNTAFTFGEGSVTLTTGFISAEGFS